MLWRFDIFDQLTKHPTNLRKYGHWAIVSFVVVCLFVWEKFAIKEDFVKQEIKIFVETSKYMCIEEQEHILVILQKIKGWNNCLRDIYNSISLGKISTITENHMALYFYSGEMWFTADTR